MAKKLTPQTGPVRNKGPQKRKGNPTKSGKIFGNPHKSGVPKPKK